MPPAPERSGARLALVIGTATYTDPGFRQLRAPAQDISDITEVLEDPAIGGFTYKAYCPPPHARCVKTMRLTPSSPRYALNLRGWLKRSGCWEEEL